jgi:hypothetical protein
MIVQNTLLVGSQGILDLRKFSKKDIVQPKPQVNAIGVSSGPATSSTVFVPMPDMSASIKSEGKPLSVQFDSGFTNTVNTSVAIFVDGKQVPGTEMLIGGSASSQQVTTRARVPANPGNHKIDVYWKTSSGTLTAFGTQRNLLVREED